MFASIGARRYLSIMAEVCIDGSMLEGGGQILRMSAALSAITRRSVQINAIRAKRSKPGLAAQHLTGLQLVSRVANGQLEGGFLGSSSVTLHPSALCTGHFEADTKTAGSCTLLGQAALPCLLYTQRLNNNHVSKLKLFGGTDADLAPPGDYLAHVLAPLLHRLFNLQLEVTLDRRGFFPKGGGRMQVVAQSLPPGEALQAVDLTTRGEVTLVTIHAFTAGAVSAATSRNLATAAERGLRKALGAAVHIAVNAVVETPASAVGNGAGILLVAESTTGCIWGASAKLERGSTADACAAIVTDELLTVLQSGSCVDQWMQDQLIIYLALAAGRSRMLCEEPSLHTRTAMVVAEQLLPGVSFRVTQASATTWLVVCNGAGWLAPVV